MDMSICDACCNVVTRGATGRGHWQHVDSGEVIQLCAKCVAKVDDFILELEKEYEDVVDITFPRYETVEGGEA